MTAERIVSTHSSESQATDFDANSNEQQGKQLPRSKNSPKQFDSDSDSVVVVLRS
eukprot:COSAG02_NODE_31563_length_531_cov_1.131944_1_plen_54_part_10